MSFMLSPNTRHMILSVVFSVGFFVSGFARAESAHSEGTTVEVENKIYWLCKNRKEVRTIRVQVDAGVCSTFYSKLGEEQRVGSGKNEGSCVNFLNNIKTNLEKSNWSCRDISSTRITASAE